MKLLFVTHHSDFVGGGELSQLQLLHALYLEGETVSLAVPEEGWCARQVKDDNIPLLCLPMPEIRLWSLFNTIRDWKRQLTANRPDVIHANTSRSCFYSGIIGRLLGIPVVFHCRIADKDPKLDWILARLVRCVVANSKTTAARFDHWKSLDVRTVYNGVDIVESDVDCDRPFGARLVLLCVARISRWKRHHLVLQTFERLARDFDGLDLVCVGAADPHEPEWWDELQKRTQQSDFSERIHWVGEQEDMTPWYCGADALFLASEREPFGRVIVEAMAYGLPVAAFNRGGPAEMMSDGVQGVLLGEEDNFSDKLAPLFADAELRRSMGDAGRKRAKEFSLAQHVRGMKRVFQDVMNREMP